MNEMLQPLLDHLSRLLPDRETRRSFADICQTPQPAAIRLNPLHPASRDLAGAFKKAGVVPASWCPHAYTLPGGGDTLGSTLEYIMGGYYVQALAQTLAVEVLGPRPGERVLDLCAAPGGKTSQIAAAMGNTGLMVVNEPDRRRMHALIGNLERCGVANALISKAPGSVLARYFHNFFDRILLDAPCSGDGTIRKELGVLGHWSPERARYRAEGQAGLLRAAFHMLRPGGVLVYSTCSLSLEENEDVLLSLIKRYGGLVEILPATILQSPPLPGEYADRYPLEFAECVRVWPHLHDTEGAFVARIGKREETEPWRVAGDAASWLSDCEAGQLASKAVHSLEDQFGCAFIPMQGQAFSVKGRYLWLQHESAARFREEYPHFVRSGLRIAKRHRGMYFLAQPGVALWGHHMQASSVELDWPQVQALFRDNYVFLRQKTDCRGITVLRFGPWALTRGLLQEDGFAVQGLLPPVMRRDSLRTLDAILLDLV